MVDFFLKGHEGTARPEVLIKQELMALGRSATLKSRLAKIDETYDFRRIYVMGCGRSGTWLLTGLFSTYSDLEIVPRELGVQHFGLLTTKKKALVIKRYNAAYQEIESIPDCIEIAYIIRHPFDVLTSHNPTTGATYHIAPHRWLGEMLSLQYLLDSKRNHTTIIKYEDLVREPHNSQIFIAEKMKLGISHPVEIMHRVFQAPSEAVSAMHGLRPIDTSSIGKHKNDLKGTAYLKSIRPRLGRLLNWVGEEYGYDISL